MTTLLKNASYLKVSHSGQTPGSLFLADLADEENSLENRKIPVYVPEGGSITLPLDEDVLLSYQQGTIRGLEDQGFLTTTLLDKPSLKPEIWVAPDGDDANPGTREAPYASIQKAHDDLLVEFGHKTHKKVFLEPGIYDESIILNSKRFTLTSANPFGQQPFDNAQIGGKVTITNATIESIEAFEGEGGVSYTADSGAGTFTYTGADMSRELVDYDGGEVGSMELVLNGISAINGLEVLHFTNEDASTTENMSGIYLKDTQFIDAYIKNIYSITLDVGNFGELVLDNSARTRFKKAGAYLEQMVTGMFIERADSSVDELTEGKPQAGYLRETGNINFDDVFRYGNVNDSAHGLDVQQIYSSAGPMSILDSSTLGGNNSSDAASIVVQDTLTIQNAASVYAKRLDVGALSKTSTGTLNASNVDCFGNVTISGGSTNTLQSGIIRGDLTVNSPATVDLTNVVVKGNLEGDGDITMTGGGYGGANNNTGVLTYNALGIT